MVVIINTIVAKTIVTPKVPIILNPPIKGIMPKMLAIQIKKKVVKQKGIKRDACL